MTGRLIKLGVLEGEAMGKVAVDITTSGFSPEVYGELIAISACEMFAPGQTGAFFHSYIRPLKGLTSLWERLLEIDNETLNSAPPLAEAAEHFFPFWLVARLSAPAMR
jgi:DNA polymerase III epsilon subunit-like protein